MELKEIKDIIKAEVEDLASTELKDLDKDIFFKSNFIDSLDMVNLIVFLEQRFDIKIDTFFLDRETVTSVSKLANSIKLKLEQKDF